MDEIYSFILENKNYINSICLKNKNLIELWELDLEEVVEDIFLNVIKRFNSYDKRKSSIKTFFINSVNFSLKDVIRNQQEKMVEIGKATEVKFKFFDINKNKVISQVFFVKELPSDSSLEQFKEKWDKGEFNN